MCWGLYLGTVAVSIYGIAATLNLLFINLSTAVSGVFLPKISKMVANKVDTKELTNEFIKIGRIQYFIIFLMCSGFVLFGKQFIHLWAGDGFEDSYYVALLLIIPVCVPLIQNIGISILQALNKFRFKSIATFIMSIFNVIISIFLAKEYGAIGAALGTCIALVICNIIIMNIYYHKSIKLNIFAFWKNILKMTIPFLIPIAIIILIMRYTELSEIVGFITYGAIYTLMFAIISYVFVMNSYEKNMLNNILVKFHLKKRV